MVYIFFGHIGTSNFHSMYFLHYLPIFFDLDNGSCNLFFEEKGKVWEGRGGIDFVRRKRNDCSDKKQKNSFTRKKDRYGFFCSDGIFRSLGKGENEQKNEHE
jgi:hypothetical protein